MYNNKYLKYKIKYLEQSMKYNGGALTNIPSLFNTQRDLSIKDFLTYLRTVDLRTKQDIEDTVRESLASNYQFSENSDKYYILLSKLLLCFTSKKYMIENILNNKKGYCFITNKEHCFKPLFYEELKKEYDDNGFDFLKDLNDEDIGEFANIKTEFNNIIKKEFDTLNFQEEPQEHFSIILI